MNDSERRLIRFVCDGDMRNAQKAVKIILNSISSKKMSSSKKICFASWKAKENLLNCHITYSIF